MPRDADEDEDVVVDGGRRAISEEEEDEDARVVDDIVDSAEVAAVSKGVILCIWLLLRSHETAEEAAEALFTIVVSGVR